MLGVVFCGAFAAAATAAVGAQNGQMRSFEVASVRLSASTTPWSQRISSTRVDLTKTDLRQLLWLAFEIEPFCCRDRLVAPAWLPSVSVDIQATIPAGATRQQVPEMLRSLLMQRLGLRTHVETRLTNGYELVVGGGGMRMQEVQPVNELDKVFAGDSSRRTPLSDRTEEMVNGPLRIIQIPLGQRMITERTMYEWTGTARKTRLIDAARMTMAELASLLAESTGGPVLDKTALTGVYKFTVELPYPAFVTQSPISAPNGAPSDPTGVSAVKAVEQLGLKMEPRRIPVDTIVVDQIQRVPSDN